MRIFFLILIFVNVYSFDMTNISFVDYVKFVSNTSKKNFILDENINKKLNLVVPYNFDPNDSYKILKSFVSKHDMYIEHVGSVYYIHKYSKDEKYHTYKLVFLLPDQILPFLKKSYPKINFFKSKRTIIYKSIYKVSKQIKEFILLLDKPTKSKIIKISLISYKESDIKDIGLNLSASSASANGDTVQYKSFLDTLVSSSSILFSTSSINISLFMNNLYKKDLLKVKFSPTLTLYDNKKTSFIIAEKIPYLNGQSVINGTNDIRQNSYSYNDVGTIIKIDNVSITDNSLYFHISLKYQTILDRSATPTTSNRSIDNYLRLDDGKSIVVSGIKSSEFSKVENQIPFLSSIPYVGNLFKWKSDNKSENTFAIIITSMQTDINYDKSLIF